MLTDTATRYVDAVAAAYSVLLDAVRTAGTTNVRLSRRLLDETERAQRRALGVARRIAENPTDLAGNVNAVIEATAEAQSQVLDLTRSLFENAPEAREQARVQFERLTRANQDVVRTALEATRELSASNPWLQVFQTARAA